MSEKSFGIKELNLMSASGTPTIESPNDIVFKSGGSNERVRITSGGNLGVGGLASPGALLSIPAGESNTPRLAIESAVDANDFTITQYEDSSGTYTMLGQNVKLNSSGNNTILDSAHRTAGILLDARNHGAITFLTGGANAVGENVKIDHIGRTNISDAGITNDDFQLQVESSTSRPAAKFYRKRNTAGGGLIEIYDDVGGTETRQFHFATGGNLTLDKGNLVIGTSGQGIDFSATGNGSGTMTSELLDDYEEGTFTPTFTASTNPTVSYNENTGRYVKVGGMCFITIRIVTGSASGGSGSLKISGLPFAGENASTSYAGSFNAGFVYAWGTLPETFLALNGSSDITLYANDSTNSTSSTSHLNNGNNQNYVNISGCYHVS